MGKSQTAGFKIKKKILWLVEKTEGDETHLMLFLRGLSGCRKLGQVMFFSIIYIL